MSPRILKSMSLKTAQNKEVCAMGGEISKMGTVQAGILSGKNNLVIFPFVNLENAKGTETVLTGKRH